MTQLPEIYVYVYLDQRYPGKWTYKDFTFEYQPFYVGKGKGCRMRQHLGSRDLAQDSMKSRRIKKILKVTGEEPIHYRIYEGLTNERALEIEADMIRHFGRIDQRKGGLLVNHTDGGEGGLGCSRPQPTFRKRVWQYTIEGDFVREWESIMSTEATYGDGSYISKSIALGNTCHGYVWSFEYLGPKIPPTKVKWKPRVYENVKQVDLKSGRVIAVHPTCCLAAKALGKPAVRGSAITACIRGKGRQAFGFFWTVLGDDKIVEEIQRREARHRANLSKPKPRKNKIRA